MSRITKWKLEKTKVKVVFRLQFHATHVPQAGWDKLFISFIPADSGKATAKTTKANVRNGTCKWADPIYETTRLLQDTKTKQYDGKLYKFVVAMGSSRSGILGEANINLADYADALKPFTVALPLQGCDFGTILHVTVQLLTSKTGFREFEQQRELRERGLHASNSHDDSGGGTVSSSEEAINDQMDKGNAGLRAKPQSKDIHLPVGAGSNDDYAESAAGFDGSSSTSESLHAERQDTSSNHEIESLKSTQSVELGGHTSGQSPRSGKGDRTESQLSAHVTNDWTHGWSSEYSADSDLAIVYEENGRLRGSLEVAESSLIDVKMEISSLRRHADELGLETQKFAQQLAEEITSGEELAKEVAALKSECSVLKEDLRRQKNTKLTPLCSSRDAAETNQNNLMQDLQLRWLNGILLMEDKITEIQNKTCLGFHEKDPRQLQSDIEALLGFLQDLKQGTGQAVSNLNLLSSERATAVADLGELSFPKNDQFASPIGLHAVLSRPEGVLHSISVPGLASHESNSLDATSVMKGKVFELLRDLDESKAERETLVRKMDQMECYYEALIQEFEENQRRILGELQNLRNEHATCIFTMSSTKAEVETMRHDMNEQILRFAADKQHLESVNKEFERRALSAEASLRRARLNYSIAVGQLQKDLQLLSSQVLSMYETNENLIKQAFVDSSQPRLEVSPQIAQNQTVGSQEYDVAKQNQCQNQNIAVRKQQLGGDILLEDLKRSLHLQQDLYQKVEEELYEMHLTNVCLDVFSKALQETLIEASGDVRFMTEKMDEVTRKLELSTKSEDSLMLKLQSAIDDVHSLHKDNATCVEKCKEMAQEKQNLEAKLQGVTSENKQLTQRISECESLLTEFKSYQSKYEACFTENSKLVNSLKRETLENGGLRNDLAIMKGELETCKTEANELLSVKENLQDTIHYLQDKLWTLLVSYDNRLSQMSVSSMPICQNLECSDLTGVLLGLKELQEISYEKILQLTKENKSLVDDKDSAKASLNTAEADIIVLKQQFELDKRDMVGKLDAFSSLVQKFQSKLETVSQRLENGLEAENIYTLQQKESLSDLDHLELQLQQLTSKCGEISQEMVALRHVNEELGESRLTMDELFEKNQSLTKSLEDKAEESAKLTLELNSLKQNLQFLHDELCIERNLKNTLERDVKDLTLQINDTCVKLQHFEEQEAEMVHLKQLVLELEAEKSRICSLLSHAQDCLKSARKDISSLADLEIQFSEIHEFAIAADVGFIFLKNQSEAWTEDVVVKLNSLDRHLADLHWKYYDAETKCNQGLANEACHIEENTRLSTAIDSLKSELDACVAQNRVFQDANDVLADELEKYKDRAEELDAGYFKEKSEQAVEIERLKHSWECCEEEIDTLMNCKEELEVQVLVLKSKLDDQFAQMSMFEGYNDSLTKLRSKCAELSQKLSEQVLKTEEFKNLAAHLKELKDKADTEYLQAREKRETEAPPAAMQESLRIAFIKEQYETKVQDLKQQLSMSKRHSEEMLLKLQDAIDEVETRKKSEATHLKRNEELGKKIMELEAELHSALSDKCETVKVYDSLKAELECCLMSLECCNEEKEKLEASLRECSEEKSRIATELTLMKKLLESSKFSINSLMEESSESDGDHCITHGPIVGTPQKNLVESTQDVSIVSANTSPINKPPRDLDPKFMGQEHSVSFGEADHTCLLPTQEGSQSQENVPSQSVNGNSNFTLLSQESLNITSGNDQLKAQGVWSSMDHLSKELEKMRNDNSPRQDRQLADANFPGLERELLQLHKANEELRGIYPLFNELSGSGNALERVLALELELAEALQAKKKSIIQFQSSFLKQHSDEEAIFKSFRDINELIEEMLDIKGRYQSVEAELKDMHERYSQLSLQFAEVEGERQKLMMTLRNIRGSKKPLPLSRSSSASTGDHSC